jgi:hypothetical protein
VHKNINTGYRFEDIFKIVAALGYNTTNVKKRIPFSYFLEKCQRNWVSMKQAKGINKIYCIRYRWKGH